MIGKTNSIIQVGEGIPVENINILLHTNQLLHDDLIGAVITLRYDDNAIEFVWDGTPITTKIAAFKDYSIEVSHIEGYRTPDTFFATSVTDNSRVVTFTYQTEKVKVFALASNGQDVTGISIYINEKEYIFSGDPIEVLIPFGVEYTIVTSDVDGLITPLQESFIASLPLREVDLVYKTCVLVINILSNLMDDDIIAAINATVKYDSNEIEVASGYRIDIPSETDITIIFPEVLGYNTPGQIKFTSTMGINEKTVTYTTEKVIVNVSTNDGDPTDDQIVTVYKKELIDYIPDYDKLDEYGVAIMDIYGKFYKDATEWLLAGHPTANGVAVSDGTHRFCIGKDIILNVVSDDTYGKDAEYWGAYYTTVSGVTTVDSSASAKADFKGNTNTNSIVSRVKTSDDYFTVAPWSAAGLCRQYIFPNGNKGYLGACGEWSLINAVKSTVNTLLTVIGGTKLQLTESGNNYSGYWTSTLVNSQLAWIWRFTENDCSSSRKDVFKFGRVRAFSAISKTLLENYIETTYKVNDGQITFNVPYATEYTIHVNNKADYETPSSVTYTAGEATKIIPMNYLTETVTVNVSSNDNDIDNYSVDIIKNEVIGTSAKYTRLEYIASTGKQYINTGFMPDQNTRVVMDALLNKEATSSIYLFGARQSSSANKFLFMRLVSDSVASWRADYGKLYYTMESAVSATERVHIDFNKNVITLNDQSYTFESSTFHYPASLYLFALDSTGTASGYAQMKLYSCQIYDNDVLVRDFIPALREDNIAGLYDAVNDVFYPSNGSLNFISGNQYKEPLHILTNVTGTYKIPFNDSYSVIANDAEDYKAPDIQTFIANQDTRTIDVTYKTENVTVNVSSDDGNVDGYDVTITKCDMIGTDTKYAGLEYIESTGTQYIDTGFKPNQNTRIVMKVSNFPNTSNTVLFGARTSATSSDRFLFISSGDNTYRISYYNQDVSLDTSISYADDMIVEQNKGVTIINGDVVSTIPLNIFSTPYSLHLLSNNNKGTASGFASVKIKYCQIYDNDVLVRDYYPVLRSDGVAGLYDAVNDTFYPSNGAGNFIAGNTITEVIDVLTSNTATYKIPFGEGYSVSASQVSGYANPATQTFIASQDSRVVNVEYQKIVHSGTTTPTNGVYIQDTDGYCHTAAEWTGEYTADCVAVITSSCRFGIALTEASSPMKIDSSYSGALEKYMTAISNETQAKADYGGATNTTNIMKLQSGTGYAAGWCNAFSFPSGKKGFLPSLGQMWAAYSNKAAVDAALTKAGGTALTSANYWTSTFFGVGAGGYRYSWLLLWSNGNVNTGIIGGDTWVRAFTSI